ncbi:MULTISPECIES: DUF2487 family protein [Paenibacillus]|uniref:DUF2487 family protein n=1 Tax=Paenibacillus TaxID=44249 RepID=UPI002FE37491
MKFSDIEPGTWEELRPYLDTCLIPVTGLTGKERPNEVVEALEKLRDVLDWVESPFHGRVVTYPSFQYGEEEMMPHINEVCRRVKRSGFMYAIVISGRLELRREQLPDADLLISPGLFPPTEEKLPKQRVMEQVQALWQGSKY